MSDFDYSDHPEGITKSENTKCVKWSGGNIWFSFSRRGNALNCHFLSHRDSLRQLRYAIEEFIKWAISEFEWCRVIFAMVVRNSVKNLIESINFKVVTSIGDTTIYMRQLWA